MKLITLLIAALVASASATYVIEWSAPLASSMCYGYTSNNHYTYDITGDSNPEIYVTDSTALKVYSGVTHLLIWTIPLTYPYGGYPIIANTDGDANKELVFSGYSVSPSYSGRFYVCDCQTHSQEFASPVKSGYINISVADVDGDNKSEICCISGAAGSRILEVYGSDAQGVEQSPAPETRVETPLPFPNPAQHVVQLPVSPGASGLVTVTDLTGRVVRVLTGIGTVVWDCCDMSGNQVPQGTYIFSSGPASGRVEVVY